MATRQAFLGIGLTWFCLTNAPVSAAGDDPPPGTCVLELRLPAGATASVDGRDYGTKRDLVFSNLRAGQVYESVVQVKFADGSQSSRTVLIEGGRRLVHTPVDPSSERPELVPQTRQFWSMGHALSADGRLLAMGGNDGMASLWDATNGRKLRTYSFTDLAIGVYPIAISPDGSRLAGKVGQGVQLWDPATGQRGRFLSSPPAKEIGAFQFSADGQLLVGFGINYRKRSGGQPYETDPYAIAVAWDVASGRVLQAIDTPGNEVRLGRQARRLLTWTRSYSDRMPVEIWDVMTGRVVRKLMMPSSFASIAVTPDEKRIAVASRENGVQLYEIDADQPPTTLPKAVAVDGGTALAFSPDAQRLLVVTPGIGAQLWDVSAERKLWTATLKLDASIAYVAFSPDGGRAIAGGFCYDPRDAAKETFERRTIQTAIALDTATGKQTATLPYDAEAVLLGTDKLVSGEAVWSLDTGKQVFALGSPGGSHGVGFSADGRLLFLGATVWSVPDGKPMRSFDQFTTFSADGVYAATTRGEHPNYSCEISTLANGQTLATLTGSCKAFSADGQLAVTGDGAHRLAVWDSRTGRRQRNFPIGEHAAWGVAIRPDRRHMVTTWSADSLLPYPPFPDCVVTVWDVAAGQKLRSLQGATDQYVVGYSPTGRYLATAGGERAILWDGRTYGFLRAFTEPDSYAAWSVAFSPDERQLLVTYRQGKSVLWDVQTGRRMRTFHDRTGGWVQSGAFSPDGRRIVTGSDVARVWDVATGDEIVQLTTAGSGEWLAATPDGFFDGSQGGRSVVSYRVGSRLDVVPVDRFFQDFYHPGLLVEILRGGGPQASQRLGSSKAPQVKIVSHPRDAEVDAQRVPLTVEVTDRGGGVKGPWLWQNGARVLSASASPTEQTGSKRTFEVLLVEGENYLEVRAASADGSWESEPAAVRLSYKQPVARARVHLLAIGINRYAEETLALKFAAADAQAIATLFSERGASLFGPENVQVTTLLDDKATTAGIQEALKKIAAAARPQDTLVVFLAGHGTVVGQRYYFIPHEFRSQTGRLDENVRDQGLPGDQLGDWLAMVPALKRVIIYDTCQSGALVNVAHAGRSPFAFRGALERLSHAQGVFTIAATAAGEEAQEISDLGHGALTYTLLAAVGAVKFGPLKNQKAEGRGANVIEVRDWFAYAQDKVPLLTRLNLGREQFVSFSGQGESFPLLPLAP